MLEGKGGGGGEGWKESRSIDLALVRLYLEKID